jgi:hypothetical protein|nr:MAG TPA: hypothetical protein [Crassvirales sp.]
MPSQSEIIKLCKKASNWRQPVFLGRFYVREGYTQVKLKSVFISPLPFYLASKEANIVGYGSMICMSKVIDEKLHYREKIHFGSWHFIYNYNTHTEGYYNLIIK